jgi:hypothetical protein
LVLTYYLQRLSDEQGFPALEARLLNTYTTQGREKRELMADCNLLQQLHGAFPEEVVLRNKTLEFALELARQRLAAEDYSGAGAALRLCYRIDPATPGLSDTYVRWVEEDYRANYVGSNLTNSELGWTGSTDRCDPGTISKLAYDRTLQRLNYYRRLAGIPDSCVWVASQQVNAQAAALCMYANGRLSHGPPADWKCYSDAASKGAGSCNLSLGETGPAALAGQVEDAGSNNRRVGHRQYILNPYRREFAIGATPGSMALYVFGKSWPDSITRIIRDQPVSWPPAAYVPTDLVYYRWHYALSGYTFANADVKMTRNGRPLEVEVYEEGGYGVAIWEPKMSWSELREPATYTVEITGAKDYDGEEVKSFRYEVRSIRVDANRW